jgi:hypothetical protein
VDYSNGLFKTKLKPKYLPNTSFSHKQNWDHKWNLCFEKLDLELGFLFYLCVASKLELKPL